MKFAILFVIVALALAAVVGIGIYKNQPETVALDSLVGVADDFLARDEVAPIDNMLKGGSLYFGVGRAEDENGQSVMGNLGAYGKIYFSEDAVALENLDVLYEDIWICGDAYISKELFLVSEEKILNGTYGASRNGVALSFSNSIFAYGSGSKYAIEDADAYDTLLRSLNALEDTTLDQDAEQLLTKIIPEIWEIICRNCEITSGNSEVTLQGTKESARIIRMIFDAEAFASTVEDVHYYLQSNDKILAFIRQHNAALSLAFGLAQGETAVDAYRSFLEEYEDEMDSICESLLRELDDEIEVKIATPKLQSKLLKLEIKQDGDTLFLLDFGKYGLNKTNAITIQTSDSSIYYRIEQNDDDAYESELLINNRKEVRINIDKSRERFEIVFDGDATTDTVTAKGTYKESASWSSLQLTKLTYSSNSYGAIDRVIKCDLMLILQQKDTMPAMSGSYTRLSAITEDEVDAWLEKINRE